MYRRTLLPLLGLLVLAAENSATWSIVCVNRRTREVGVATATCITDFNIRTAVPVIFVGEGAGAAQSFIDTSAVNRRTMYFSFRDTEETPADILAQLAQQDPGHETRQYGIVNFAGAPITFTGSRDGLAATGVTGEVGDIWYAIQGNVLAGNQIVFAAEAAFRTQKGDLGQKMMAAMEAARALGGDGRCSCDPARPTSCGVPPPNFTKAAHVGTVIVARVGDTNSGCNSAQGCAQGEYYLNLNVVHGGASDPDPVFTLRDRYDKWRLHLLGRPDAIASLVGAVKQLPADGTTERRVTLELHDLDDHRIAHGGAQLEVVTADGLPSLATVGPVTDLGNGRYTFDLRAGTQPGLDRFLVRVTDVLPSDPSDVVTATLYPPIEVATVTTALYVGEEELSASSGGHVAFVVNRADEPLAPYWLVARLASPLGDPRRALARGFPVLPLAQSPFFPGAPGTLDARGRAEAPLDVPAGALASLVGLRVEVTGYVQDGAALTRTNPAGFEIRP
jgi:uncharacterized Ntn-hydrolase superfamily protein